MFLIPQVLEPILEPQLPIWISGLLLKNLTLRASNFIFQDLGLNFFGGVFFLVHVIIESREFYLGVIKA
jgi:hypothetical protein